MTDPEILILGGGPAGMACAWELAKGGTPALVIERNDRVGGLARTLAYELPGAGTFRTDIGPHRFYSKNRYLYAMVEDLLGPHWIAVRRFTRFYVGGRFYRYPPELLDVLRAAGPVHCARMLGDFAMERARGLLPRAPIKSFEQFAVRTFGRRLAELNVLNYTEKIWGIPCRAISPDWAAQRIAGLGVRAILEKALLRRATSAKSMVHTFYYPDRGAGLTYERIRERAADVAGSRVLTGTRVVGLRHDGSAIREVLVDPPEGPRRAIPCRHCVNSIPITDLVAVLDPPAPPEVIRAAGSLRYRSQVYVFLLLDRDRVGPDNWVYFPDAEIPFGRITEPKSFSPAMAPEGRTSLWVEHFCFEGDATWRADPTRLAAEDIRWLERLGFLRASQVLGWRYHREREAYPVYAIGYREHLDALRAYLARFTNLLSVGRGGRFRYNNQDHALETGILAARAIRTGRPVDLEAVGAEQAYFESGYVPAASRRVDPESEMRRRSLPRRPAG